MAGEWRRETAETGCLMLCVCVMQCLRKTCRAAAPVSVHLVGPCCYSVLMLVA